MSGPGDANPPEQHLGDRLAALVDGELSHDTRERVLAHLATCCRCKAEADAQRRLKSVFAQAAPPPPTEGFLARLQGLPQGSCDPDDGPPPGFGLGGRGFPTAQPGDAPGRAGFRIHDVERSSSRGRRFAFVAAGAMSVAAFALSGTQPLDVPTGLPGTGGSRAASTPPRSTPAPGRSAWLPASPPAAAVRSRGPATATAGAPDFLRGRNDSGALPPLVSGPRQAGPAATAPPSLPLTPARPPAGPYPVSGPGAGPQGLAAAGEPSAGRPAGSVQPAADRSAVPFRGH